MKEGLQLPRPGSEVSGEGRSAPSTLAGVCAMTRYLNVTLSGSRLCHQCDGVTISVEIEVPNDFDAWTEATRDAFVRQEAEEVFFDAWNYGFSVTTEPEEP